MRGLHEVSRGEVRGLHGERLQYAAESDWPSALIEFKNAARSVSTEAEPYYQMALIYTAQGQVQDAVGAVQQAVSLDPNHVEANLLLARFMVRLGDVENLGQAEEILNGVLGETRDNADALFVLAATRARMGAHDEAATLLQEALATTPDHLKASIALAKLHLNDNDVEGAEAILQEAVDKASDKHLASIALGQFYMGVNQVEQARERFEAVLSDDPQYGPALLGLGMLNLRIGDKDGAEDAYRRLSRLEEKQYHPLYGQVLAANGKTDEAIAEFRRLLEENPDNRDVRNRLVYTLMADNRLEETEEVLGDALARSENDTDARLQRAELLRRRGSLSEAEEDLSRVLEFRPDSEHAHFYLSRIHAERGDSRLQRQELDEALRINPSFIAARLDLSKALLASPTPRGALEVLDEAPDPQKQTPGMIAARVWALISLGDDEIARRTLDPILNTPQGAASAEFLVQDAMLKLRARDYNAARAAAEKALEISPTDLRAINIVSGSHSAQQHDEQAVDAVRRQAEAYPESTELQLALAAWYERVGDKEKARSAYQDALALGDRENLAATKLAAMDFEEGNYAAAESKLRNALDEDPNNIRALLSIATLHEKQGQFAEAIGSYRRVLEIRPDFYPALNNLAYLLATEANQLDEALGYAQQAKELAPPNNGLVDDTIGWVFYLKGVYPTAAIHLQGAAKNDPNNAMIRYHLAMAQAKAGNLTAAQKAYEEALQLNSNLAEASQTKEILDSLR